MKRMEESKVIYQDVLKTPFDYKINERILIMKRHLMQNPQQSLKIDGANN
jgi:hypothetical protein